MRGLIFGFLLGGVLGIIAGQAMSKHQLEEAFYQIEDLEAICESLEDDLKKIKEKPVKKHISEYHQQALKNIETEFNNNYSKLLKNIEKPQLEDLVIQKGVPGRAFSGGPTNIEVAPIYEGITRLSAVEFHEENLHYDKILLIYYVDGFLTDEYDELIENISDVVGPSLDYLDDNDIVYCRNDNLAADYEIHKTMENYAIHIINEAAEYDYGMEEPPVEKMKRKKQFDDE